MQEHDQSFIDFENYFELEQDQIICFNLQDKLNIQSKDKDKKELSKTNLFQFLKRKRNEFKETNLIQKSFETNFLKKRFVKISLEDFQQDEKDLSEQEILKILEHKNSRILFQQNCFGLKKMIITKGTPKPLRLQMWNYLGQKSKLCKKFKVKYLNLLKNKFCSDYQQILKDVNRTFASEFQEQKQKELFLCSLTNVLVAFSNFDPKIGYVQGMNIIVASLLYNLSDGQDYQKQEENVFWLLISLMEHYEIKNCYIKNMQKIFELSNDFELFVFKRDAELFNFINHEENNVFICLSSLFFTLGLHVVPISISHRILDLIFFFNAKILVKLYYLLLKRHKKQILMMKDNLLYYIRYEIIPKAFLDSDIFESLFKELNNFVTIEDFFVSLD